MFSLHTLSNRVRILHVHKDLPISYIGVAIDSGTRDELENESGIAHFTEHLMFKGTTHRKAHHIISRLESVGGQMDAYTTKEDTYVYSTVPAEYSERALELLSDVVLNSTFPENEMEKERIVVVDEIDCYKDSPAELIYDEFEEKLFPGQAIGRNILGSEETLENFDTKSMLKYVKRCYTADRLLVFAMGSMSEDWLMNKVEKYFSAATGKSKRKLTPIVSGTFNERIKMDTNQIHCIIGTSTPKQECEDRYKMVLLNNILGGPNMSSLLNMAIRERHGYCYTIESSLTGYVDTGVWTLYFGCDEHNMDKAYNLCMKQLDMIKAERLTERQLAVAKKQLRGQVLISRQNNEAIILGLSKQVLHHEKVRPSDVILSEIDTYTPEDIRSTAENMLNNLSTLIYM